MKIGVRKPSIKKSIRARTTGKAKRAVKKAVIPGYGKKGTGWIKDPKRAAYNKVYNKTTVSAKSLVTSGSKKKSTSNKNSYSANTRSNTNNTYNAYSTSSIGSSSTSHITLINNNGKIKNCKIGYSWTNMFLGFLVPIARLDFKNFIIQYIAFMIFSQISPTLAGLFLVIMAGFYNKIYIKDLVRKGYKPSDEHSMNMLNKVGIKFEQNEEVQDDVFSESIDDDIVNEDSNGSDINHFTNFSDYASDEVLDELGISITMSVNGKEIVDNDIKVNDSAPEGYHKIYDYEKVVGVTFDNREIFVEQFTNGFNQKVKLEREKDNQYDKNAIKVFGTCNLGDDTLSGELGYLSSSLASKLKDFSSIYGTVNAVYPPNKIRLDIWVNEDENKIIDNFHKQAKKTFKLVEEGYKSNCKAMSYEKEKDIPNAIKYYEESISYNFDGNHPYDRLAILYRKVKDYDNEIRVLNKAIENFSLLQKTSTRGDVSPKLNKFKERLAKAEQLKLKSS